jgi:Flp pilus assembly pilin Flp
MRKMDVLVQSGTLFEGKLTELMNSVASHRRSIKGATAVEYAIILSLIAGVIIAVVAGLGGLLSNLYTSATQGW